VRFPYPHNTAAPHSSALLRTAAEVTGGSVFAERQLRSIEAQARRIVRQGTSSEHVTAYARMALAPWFALADVLAARWIRERAENWPQVRSLPQGIMGWPSRAEIGEALSPRRLSYPGRRL
jgi:hypothetical protein